MSKKLFHGKIYVKKSPTHGYGVFAGKNFKKGEMIEECYFIVTEGGDEVLDDFYFQAGDDEDSYALLTGYGVIYNHSQEPNADYNMNLRRKIVTITADAPIKKDEEIFVTYGDEWFEARNKVEKKPRKRRK